jgi:ATP-binding cassette subfamily B protein
VKTTALIYQAIMPILNIISATFILIAIYLTILFSYPLIALCFGIILSTIYIFISRLTKIYLHENSKVVSKGQVDIIKALQEGLGGIRDVLIDGTQEVYCKLFEKANYTLQTAQSNIQFIGGVPRFVIEPLSILLISFLALYLSRSEEGMLGAIPVLAILAYSAQRMLPLMQILFGSWATLTGGLAPVSDAIEFLDQRVEKSLKVSSVKFHDFKIIELHKCSFRYDSGPYILKNINLKISCGETIGIIGTTGCGKSTLLDILMGLIDPLEGFYLVDGIEVLNNNRRQWQNLIGHVSQNIFISDASLAENIAFGLPLDKINYERVKLAAKRAELSDTIDSLADGYFTKVGERGVRLSGGQRQRIGLARAFYKDVKLLILDEATSALDESTEDIVMKSICRPDSKLTKIIVAHRLRSLKYCDKIIELQEGSIKSISKYQEVFSKSNQANK